MISFITPSHNGSHLKELYESLIKQTTQDWEWIIVKNGKDHETFEEIRRAVGKHKRVKFISLPENLEGKGVGAIKQWSFMQGRGDYLAELDHDDLLVPTAVEDLQKAFKETDADFVYSNTADFFANGNGHWFPRWKENGWRYRDTYVEGKWYNECISFEPSAATLGLIYYAPNHIRCWKKEFYHKIGGHDPAYQLCDDHELCIRTYLQGKMYHLNKLIYLYRMGEQNTFSKNLETIRNLTFQLYIANIENLIARESELTHFPVFDLSVPEQRLQNWPSVGNENAQVICNLNERWPFEDNSVLAFRAHSSFEHFKDKKHLMSEVHRCLKPGGWALIQAAFTNANDANSKYASSWNENFFWFYTRPEQAMHINNTDEHFIEQRLFTFYPSEQDAINKIQYTKAELIAMKGNMIGIPGFRRFKT